MRRSLTLNDTIRFQGSEKWLGKRLACFRKLANETLALPKTSKGWKQDYTEVSSRIFSFPKSG